MQHWHESKNHKKRLDMFWANARSFRAGDARFTVTEDLIVLFYKANNIFWSFELRKM
jgi:hypothetical protein